ncbi:hypothetical protein MASR2M36_19360 [Providencia sp.]
MDIDGIRYIERHYGRRKTRDIAKTLGRTATAIRLQAQKLDCYQSKRSRWRDDEKEQIFMYIVEDRGLHHFQKITASVKKGKYSDLIR